MCDFIHICDTKVGHPWNVAEILEDVVVYRFTTSVNTISSNSGVAIKWLHAIKEETFLKFSSKELEDFRKKYGEHLSAIRISYGEVVGISGWDVTFLPEDVIEMILL